MTALLYYSISENLTKDEINEINSSVAKSRQSVYLFVRNLPYNSKRKAKIVLLYATFIFQLGQPLAPYATAVMVPLPTQISIEHLVSAEVLRSNNQCPGIAPIIKAKMDKMILTDQQVEDLNIMCYKLQKGSISLDKAVLKLRAGGFYDWAALAFIIYMFSLQQGHSFQTVPLPHQDPLGWLSGKYDSRNVGPSPSPTISTLKRSTALQCFGPSQTQASTFNNPDGSVNLDMGYQEVRRRSRFSENFNCSFDRFVELASETGENTTDSMRAAISALQLEADGIVSNVRRDPRAEKNGVKSFDYLADGHNGETHLEIKGPVGSEIKKASGLGPSVTKQGKKLGFKIKNQLNYWFNPENTDRSKVTLPKNRSKVLVVNDLFDVPVSEKAQMESSIKVGLKGAHPILFINNRINR